MNRVHLLFQLLYPIFPNHLVDVFFIVCTNQKTSVDEYQPSYINQTQEIDGAEEDQQENGKLDIWKSLQSNSTHIPHIPMFDFNPCISEPKLNYMGQLGFWNYSFEPSSRFWDILPIPDFNCINNRIDVTIRFSRRPVKNKSSIEPVSDSW